MHVVLTEDCQKQIDIIKRLTCVNNDYLTLYMRIAMYVDALQKSENIDQLEFGINERHANNRLSGKYSDVATRDLDPFQRMAYFDRDNNAVIVTSFGHYNIDLAKSRSLFTSYRDQVDKVKEMKTDEFISLKIKSKPFVKHLLLVANQYSIEMNPNELNRIVKYEYICPVSLATVSNKLKSFVEKSVYKDHFTMDQAFVDFLSKNDDVLTKTTVNARGLSNVAAVVLSNNDLKKTMLTKLEVDKSIIRQFSDLVSYINRKMNNSPKREIIHKLTKDFLEGFDKSHAKEVGLGNLEYSEQSLRNEYRLMRKMDNRLRESIINDFERLKNFENINFLSKTNANKFFNDLFSVTNTFTSMFHDNCQKLDLLPSGKSKENFKSLLKQLGLEKGSLLKRVKNKISKDQSNHNTQDISKSKNGHHR